MTQYGDARYAPHSIIIPHPKTEPLRQQVRRVHHRQRPDRAGGKTRRHQARIDGGVDQPAGSLYAGPIQRVIANGQAPGGAI